MEGSSFFHSSSNVPCLICLIAGNQELVYYKFHKNSIVPYTIVADKEALNLALDTTFPLSYL